MIEQTRLLTLQAAHALDKLGNRAARKQVKHNVLNVVPCCVYIPYYSFVIILHTDLYSIL